jgi:hypothetical protein
MKIRDILRDADSHVLQSLVAILFLLVLSLALAHAQGSPAPGTPPGGPATPGGGAGAAAVVLVLLVLVAIIGLGVRSNDLKRARESEAVHLQAQISDALLRERSLTGPAITPTVRLPVWKGSPATIEVAGHVPSPEAREMVIRIIRTEAARTRSDFEIDDRLTVEPLRVA